MVLRGVSFDAKLKDGTLCSPRVEFMGSDGGLLGLNNFSGLKSILSGPAGSVVCYALTSWDEKLRHPIIGWDLSCLSPIFFLLVPSLIKLDVGGTSTDVSRCDGRHEVVYETTTTGVMNPSPQLDINTVATCGGSCLTFRNGLFLAGPESAGAQPGPACYRYAIPSYHLAGFLDVKYYYVYRKGGSLSVTDANLILGRLVPEYFPKIFGKSKRVFGSGSVVETRGGG